MRWDTSTYSGRLMKSSTISSLVDHLQSASYSAPVGDSPSRSMYARRQNSTESASGGLTSKPWMYGHAASSMTLSKSISAQAELGSPSSAPSSEPSSSLPPEV